MKKRRENANRKINFTAISLFVLSSLVFTGCDKDEDDEPDATVSAQTAQIVSDKDFMVRTAHINRAEIELGQLAQSKGNSTSIRNYGTLMVSEHTAAQNELAIIAANKGMTLATTLDSSNAALKQQLMNLSGPQFDSVYIHSQVAGHQMTQNLFESEISNGQDQDAINYATKYLPHVTMHLQLADSLSRSH